MVLSCIKSAMCQFFQLDKKVILLDISVHLTSEMIENHDFFCLFQEEITIFPQIGTVNYTKQHVI